jgi:alpha-glucosidase
MKTSLAACPAVTAATRTHIRQAVVLIVLAVLSSVRASAQTAAGWHHIGSVQHVEKLSDGVELSDGTAKVRITAIRDGIVRVRIAPDGNFPKDTSWAVIQSPEPLSVQIDETSSEVHLATGSVRVIVQKSPLLITFADASGRTLLADEPSLPMAWDNHRVRIWKSMPADENYYGLGDKTGPMNRRNRSFNNWNTDEFGFSESSDPIYKTIPFFLGLRHGTAYGLFFDNTYRSSFDFGKESQQFFSFGADGGEINYYYFAGPDPKQIISAYTALTGRAPLPPYWTLGYQQCRFSYYPEARVREIAKLLRDKKIPADVIYLDIDYQQDYAPFTVNRQYFPHFEQMIADLRAQGIRTVAITDLHIKKNPDHGYVPYDSGMANDAFVKKADGSVFVGPVWPGDSVFPDFTLTRVRDWWGTLFKDFVAAGVAGFWNDMNEPSVFRRADKTMPLDNVHRLDDGTTLDHRAVHNFFGMENVRATYDGLRKLQPDERPFVLTRAAYSGTERYAETWTGDNSATWNHLWMSNPMLLSLGLSGYPLAGADVGGFAGTPPPDLLTRWYELGVFNVIYRNHANKGTGDHEPWASGPQHEAIRRRYIELRYKLLPYIYTGLEETTRTGIPLMRPIFLDYPQLESSYGDDSHFLFGHDFFVSPVVTDKTDAMDVSLPPGDWYDFWSAQKHSSSEKISLHPPIDELPLYVRAGAIIPMQPVVQSTSEKPSGPLQLRVYPGEDCRGSLYQDDGHTFAYQRGEFLRINYSCQITKDSITVTSEIAKSQFKPWWTKTEVTIYGIAAEPGEAAIGDRDGQNISWPRRYDPKAHTVTLTIPPGAALTDWGIWVEYR